MRRTSRFLKRFRRLENDYEATITLRGKESVPEVVEFNVSNKSNGPVFKKVQKVVSSFTFQKVNLQI